jgi:hypothetical protein
VTPKPLATSAAVIRLVSEAQEQLAHGTPRSAWWAHAYLADAAKELAALRRLVAKLPREA